MICGLSLKWKVTCVKYIDRWTQELTVLQGQMVIALLLSHATKICTLTFSSYSAHQQNSTRMKWRGQIERGREKKKEKGIQIDRLVARSVIVILGGWMNVFDGQRLSENKRNWLGPSGRESMCEGHVSAVLLICAGLWGLSKVWEVLDVTAKFSFKMPMFCLLLCKDRKTLELKCSFFFFI